MKISNLRTLVFLLLVLVVACAKDDDKTASLLGAYTRMQTVDGLLYKVQLSFTNNNLLKWEPIDSIPGHTASAVNFELNDVGFRIYGDSDCNSEALYSYGISDQELTITAISDDCSPREAAMSGMWTRVSLED